MPHLWPTGSLGVAPIDYGPVLLPMPFGFHVAMDTLYHGAVQTMPCARPRFEDLLWAAIANDFSSRGEFTGEV